MVSEKERRKITEGVLELLTTHFYALDNSKKFVSIEQHYGLPEL